MKELTEIDILSSGKVFAALYALIGLVAGICLLFFMVIAIGLGEGHIIMGILVGLFFLILTPAMYGVMGFIGGILTAVIYNLMAMWVGGIKLDI